MEFSFYCALDVCNLIVKSFFQSHKGLCFACSQCRKDMAEKLYLVINYKHIVREKKNKNHIKFKLKLKCIG